MKVARTSLRIAGAAALAGTLVLTVLLALPRASERGVATQRAVPSWSKASLAFEPNAGRVPGGADYYARVPGAGVALSRDGARLEIGGGRALTSRLVGASAADPRPQARLRTRVNDLRGNDASRWRHGLPTFGRVRYPAVYPGIDLVYHGRRGALEYDFELAPGADPSRIAMDLRGADSLRIARDGTLIMSLGDRIVKQRAPIAYQGDARVPAQFVLDGERVAFKVGAYDRSKRLVIDPVVVFADYLATSASDFAYDVGVDSSQNVYVVGYAGANSLPGGTANGSGPGSYLMRIAADGSRTWITWISGSVTDLAMGPDGSPYVTGMSAGGLATTAGASQPNLAGGQDAFVGRFNTDGTRNWLTYFGGTADDNSIQQSGAIAVDRSGAAYVSGHSKSTGLAVCNVAFCTVYDSAGDANGDAFVSRYSASGTRQTTTYLGGGSFDAAFGVGVAPTCESNCPVYVTGATSSSNFPTGGIGADTTWAGVTPNFWSDAFAVRLSAGLDALNWGTYYGDAGIDYAYDLAVSPEGNPTIVGYNDPDGATGQAFIHTFAGPSGTYVHDARFGGANGDEIAHGVAVDAQNNVYIVGNTSSTDFPMHSPVQQNQAGSGDAFVVKLNRETGHDYVWSTYYGGGEFDTGNGIAVDSNGTAYIVGDTFSNDLPRVGGQQSNSNPYDGWVAKLQMKPVVIQSGPEGTLRGTDATFTYSMAEPSPTYVCRLTPIESEFTSCANTGKAYSGLADGNYTFEVRGVDTAETAGAPTARSFTVDTRPVAHLAIAPNPSLVGRPVTFDGSASSGAAGRELVKFEWDLDGDGSFERDTGSAATTTQTYPSPVTVPIGMRVTDSTGASATTGAELRVNPLPTAGTQFGVTINKGAQYTKSPDVTVTASFPPSSTSMLLSNDGGFLAPSVFPAATSVKWKLDSSGPERLPKTIYVRFLIGTVAGETFQDDIILDEVPPKVQQAIVAPAAAASGAVARSSALRRWKLRVRATDTNSGVSRVQVTSNKRKPGRLLRYKRRMVVRSKKRPRFVRARDRAGNSSRWRRTR